VLGSRNSNQREVKTAVWKFLSFDSSKNRIGGATAKGIIGDMNAAVQANTSTLRYLPIPETIALEARRTRKDRFGHDLRVTTNEAPCRICLRISRGPERLILLSYQPLPDSGPYAEIGPIFVHAHRCEPYDDFESFPQDFAGRRLVLRAYDHDGQIVDALVAEAGTAPQRAAALLSDRDVAEVHVRHESYTCYDFKIVRSVEPARSG
jgi:hypothetical protein